MYHDHHAAVQHETVVVSEMVRTTPSDTAKIVVEVPKDAKVFINGSETKATGTTRQFVSKGLEDGVTYRYDVRIMTADEDAALEQTKSVTLSRGKTETVRFDAAAATAVKPAEPRPDSVASTTGN